jgi:hypothetical protein
MSYAALAVDAEVQRWRSFAARARLPDNGIWFLVPDDGDGRPGAIVLIHEETGRQLPIMMSKGETMEQVQAVFRRVLPRAEILIPSVAASKIHES